MSAKDASGSLRSAPNALVVLVACGFLFSGACARPNGFTQDALGAAPRRRTLSETEPFKVIIKCDHSGVTNSPNPLFTVDFGRSIQENNPLALFTITGSNRVDVVYSKDGGVLYVVAFVANTTQATEVKLRIAPGVAVDVAGATNEAATLAVNFQPSEEGDGSSSPFAAIASWGMAGSLALSFGAAAISPGGAIGVGAINFAGFAQTFAMSGSLPITNMPENYRAAASNMDWVILQPKVGPVSPAPTAAQKEDVMALADQSQPFPYPPVALVVEAEDTNTNSTTPIGDVPSVPSVEEEIIGAPGVYSPGNRTTTVTLPDPITKPGEGGNAGKETTRPGHTTVILVIVPLPVEDLIDDSTGAPPNPFKPSNTTAEEEKEAAAASAVPVTAGGGGRHPIPVPIVQEGEGEVLVEGEVDVKTDPVVAVDGTGSLPTPIPVISQPGTDIFTPDTSGLPPTTTTTPLPTPTSSPSPAQVKNITGVVPPAPKLLVDPRNNQTAVDTGRSPSADTSPDSSPDSSPSSSPNTSPGSSPGSPGSNPSGKPSPPRDNLGPGMNTGQNGEDGGQVAIPSAAPAAAPAAAPSGARGPPSLGPTQPLSDKVPVSAQPPSTSNSSDSTPYSDTSPSDVSPGGEGNGEGREEGVWDRDRVEDKDIEMEEASLSPSPRPWYLIVDLDELEREYPEFAPRKKRPPPRSMPPPRSPKAKKPSPSLSRSPSPSPTPSSNSNDNSKDNSTSPSPNPVPDIVVSDSGTTSGKYTAGNKKNNRNSKNAEAAKPNQRRLLIEDPLAALSSSGFSYVVTTATPDGIATGTQETGSLMSTEVVGSSALSRIRTIQTVSEGPDADARRLDALWDVLFWSGVAIGSALVLHLLALAFLKWCRKVIPKMLHLPRLELLVFMIVLPMISAAGAGLLQATSSGAIAAGIFFGIVLPFGFLIVASIFLVIYLLRDSLERRRALYVVLSREGDDAISVEGSANSGSSSLTGAMLIPSTAPDSAIPAEGAAAVTAPAPQEQQVEVEDQAKDWRCTRAARSAGRWTYTHILRPVFGFPRADAAGAAPTDEATWLGRGKWDAEFVKRYGCLFEDARGPQVLRVRSQYEAAFTTVDQIEETVGSGILVPASPHGTDGAMQALQTFGIVFAVTKMVLFAVVINAPGGVNSAVQVVSLLVVAALHVAYLRICTPYRLRVELAAEMVASLCDAAVFGCGVALVARKEWPSEERHSMGIAMLALQAVGFLIFITVRVALALRTLDKTLGPAIAEMLPGARRRKAKGSSVDLRAEVVPKE